MRSVIIWSHSHTHTQFVHHAINDLCEKRGLQYEDFAKKISLAEYSQLKRVLYTTLRLLARENGRKEEVCIVYMCVSGWCWKQGTRFQLLVDGS